jgi:hypothetical protein
MRFFSQSTPVDAIELTPRPGRLFTTTVIVVCVWALIEAPLELGGSLNSTALLAVAASKVLIILIGMAAIVNLRFARQVFTFICGASVFAIAPALPLEYTRSVAIAIFSTVECIAKAACVTSFAIAPLASGGVSARLHLRSRRSVD